MRAAVYTRISQDTAGQALGVKRQLEDCLALADRLGWEVVAHHDDNDLSAFSGKTRPGFEALLAAMEAGEIGGLLCWHTDRLYRSMKDLERLIEIADARRVQIRTVNGGDLDLSTSAGRMLARILGSVARQESEHKGERQRRANDQAAAAGKWVSANRPFGYTIKGEIVPEEAAMIRQAARDVLASKSIRAVSKEWIAAGVTGTRGRPFTSPNVRRLLMNPRYAAIVVHRGREVGPGQWEPILDVDTHRGLVAFLSDPARHPGVNFDRKYIGSGVYLCGLCGGPMRHALAGNPTAPRYECRDHQHVVRRGEPVDEWVETVVLQYLSRPDIPLRLDDGRTVDVAELQAQRAGLQARLDELAGLFADGAVDGSQLRRGTTQLRGQLAGIDAELAELARKNPAADLIGAGEQLRERWDALTPDLKGKVISELVTVTIMPAGRRGPGFDRSLVVVEPRA
ncbi:site-specific recombinase DNA invertase Pin [Mycolicibacter terrae]|uniref:Site-specific recombinase DNA invertase Pin n=1 Tax=Mycolicibacter terrae TaxID=1788 RepID=A0AAD1HWV2_9MYCO|nr:recombinase family protein [Mycolicibacter terrae]ORW92433.1 serine recombinase [Mycolicibacter terrae]BBX23047.1 site-specific recombinase DNA invertase Pin [Mycolicibacter terrae]SNV68594.1 recombinase [Mycolicibacter terrae]